MFLNTRRKFANLKQNTKKIQTMVFSPSIQLKMFQNRFRECETAEEERRILLTECTFIREAFYSNRLSNANQKLGCLLKLMYISSLGLVETVKGEIAIMEFMCAKYFESVRIACLAASLLLDEHNDILLLMTNAVQNLLDHTNILYQSMALNVTASIGSKEMCSELAVKVSNLMVSSDVLIRKKAAICCFVIVRKVPELADMFVALFDSYAYTAENHSNGLLISNINLISELCNHDIAYRIHFKQMIPIFCRILKRLRENLLKEYEVHFVADPFLQVKLIKLLVFLECDSTKPDLEVLQQLLTMTAIPAPMTKNAGYAIFFEACRAILDLNADSNEKRMVIGKLDKIVENVAEPIDRRYVALNMLISSAKPDERDLIKYLNSMEIVNNTELKNLMQRKMELPMQQLLNVEIVEAPANEPAKSPLSTHEEDLAVLFGITKLDTQNNSSIPEAALIDFNDPSYDVPFLLSK